MYFIGDGTEVVACEAFEANARHELARLKRENPDENYGIYECDPEEETTDSSGKTVLAYPHEHAAWREAYGL